ncbi:hypothetical protein [Halopiger djelfimassiliensis]|nr:hypothetical protein [Halopiger djelfimassiliensis]
MGAVAGVIGTGGEGGALVFGPMIPGLVVLYAARGDVPLVGPTATARSD